MAETPLEFQRKKNHLTLLLTIGFVVLSGVFGYYGPGMVRQPLNTSEVTQLYFRGKPVEWPALYKEEHLYLPLDFIKEYLDPGIQWDDKNETVIVTTSEEVYHFPLGTKEGLLNLEPYPLTFPALLQDGLVYLPLEPLQDLYYLDITENSTSSVVAVHQQKEPLQEGRVLHETKIRLTPSVRSAWVDEAQKDEQASILREEQGWFWMEFEDGRMGYVKKEAVELAGIQVTFIPPKVYTPWNPLGEPLVLTWEYVDRITPSPEQLGALQGVHVLSPTWFSLREDGLVLNRADSKYVEWAHRTGRQVWGLFSNSFDPGLTQVFLNDSKLRIKVIKQLLSYVELYELDGVNLDFENMYLQDREAFVQFVRELAPLLHEKRRTLSVDVTFHSQSETWSMCYDRQGLPQAADYLIVMGYDEYSAGSKKAGSVSSLPWVESGIQKMLLEVPPDKLVLGVPFYTRLWTEERGPDGQVKLTSKALSLERSELWVKEHKAVVQEDRESGQHYIEVTEKDAAANKTFTYRMWLEDEYSLNKRIRLMKKYRLAGIAAWRRGLEKDGTWPVISRNVKTIN